MPMSVGDTIIFREWNSGSSEHDEFYGEVRVIPGAAGANKMHVEIEDTGAPNGSDRQINNVDNEDTPDDDTLVGKDYWLRK